MHTPTGDEAAQDYKEALSSAMETGLELATKLAAVKRERDALLKMLIYEDADDGKCRYGINIDLPGKRQISWCTSDPVFPNRAAAELVLRLAAGLPTEPAG
ncbi:MAG TPA: hypothetical protein VN719_04130 [Gemmatimonadales bacterium]|nr:hypothetical protein [Gemmatimonadales bacterium]